MRDPNSLGRFSAGPSNDMSGNLRFLFLTSFSCLLNFIFISF